MIKKVEKAFESYTDNYDKNIKQIRYKYHHSHRVEKLMKELSDALKLSKEKTEVAEAIGLLHDIGRFEQVNKYKSCSDIDTKSDHADESCKYLFDDNHIRDFIDDNKYDEILYDAIKYHNKHKIDSKVTGENLFFAKMIRDMDKIDIYRVLSEEYVGHYDKDKVSKNVREAFDRHETIKRTTESNSSDNVLVRFAFIFDMNFKESFNILTDIGYLEKYISTIEVEENSKESFNELVKTIYDYIEKKEAE